LSIIAAAGAEEVDRRSDVKDAFLADVAGVKEGPLALYKKQREEGLYRKVGALQRFGLLCSYCALAVEGHWHSTRSMLYSPLPMFLAQCILGTPPI
jgi:hypothetical protein